MVNIRVMKAPNTDKIGKGIAKVSERDKVFKNRDTTTGKRKVRIDEKTVIYSRFDTDEQAIENYNMVHGLTAPKGNK